MSRAGRLNHRANSRKIRQRTGTAWLAFWGQVLQVKALKRVQSVYQRRTLSNLRSSLKKLMPPEDAQHLAAMIAAMIDGLWLRAALSGWREADSESARAMLTAFVDGRLELAAQGAPARTRAVGPAAGSTETLFDERRQRRLDHVAPPIEQVNAAVRTAQRRRRVRCDDGHGTGAGVRRAPTFSDRATRS